MNHSLLNPSVSKYWTLPLATLGICQGSKLYEYYIVTGNMFETYNLFLVNLKFSQLPACLQISNLAITKYR